jgi:hypothetical protein
VPLLLLPQSAAAAGGPAQAPDRIAATRRPVRVPAPRRGRFLQVTLAVVAPTAPAYPFELVTGRRPTAAIIIRRGRFQPVPAQQVYPPEATVGRRVPPATVRRGRFHQVRPVVAAAAPTWSPEYVVGRRLALLAIRRGRFLQVPLVAAVQIAPDYPPESVVGRKAVPFAIRRGRFYQVPLVGAAPVVSAFVPDFLSARRGCPLARRAGRFGQVPLADPAPPAWKRARVNPPRPRRGRFTEPLRAAPYPVPRCGRNRRPTWPGIRQGRFHPLYMVGAPPPAFLPDLNPLTGTFRAGHTGSSGDLASSATAGGVGNASGRDLGATATATEQP